MDLQEFRQRWDIPWQRTLAIIFFAQLMTAVGFSSIFPFLPFYVSELGSSTSLSVEVLSGLVFSAQAFTMMLASPIWGSLADRLGRKLMVERAMFGGSVILFLMAFAQNAEQLVILRALQGLITGTIAASNALVAAAVPRDRTGYAMGAIQVGFGAGVAFGPLVGGAVADLLGYSASFFVTSAFLFTAGILVWLGIEEQFEGQARGEAKGDSLWGQWREILGGQGVLPLYGMRFFTQLGRMLLLPITPLFVQLLLDNSEGINILTGAVVGLSSASTTLSSLVLGSLGDRIGHRKVLLTSALAAAACYAPQSSVTQVWQLFVLVGLTGIAVGGIIPSISALLTAHTLSGSEGAVFGLDNSVGAGARALAPLLGSLAAFRFGLRSVFLFSGLALFVVSLLAVFQAPARPTRDAVGDPA